MKNLLLAGIVLLLFSCSSCKKGIDIPVIPAPVDDTKITFTPIATSIVVFADSMYNLGDVRITNNSDSGFLYNIISIKIVPNIVNAISKVYVDGDSTLFIGDSVSFKNIFLSSKQVISKNIKVRFNAINLNNSNLSLNYFYQNKTKAGEGTNLSNLSLIQYVSVNVDSSYLGDNPIGYGYEPDTFLLGKSVAKSMVLYAEEAGIARVDVLGEMIDKTIPFSHYWINSADDTDLGVAASTYNSRVAKTIITANNFIINLARGKNVICFKTKSFNPAGGNALISDKQKIGFKIRTKNKIFCNEKFFVKSDEKDLADKIVVQNYFANGGYVAADGISNTQTLWGGYWITPKDAGNNYVNNFPQIISMGLSTKYYADNFPELDFTNKGNESFYVMGFDKLIKDVILPNQTFVYNKKNNFLKLNFNPACQIYRTDVDFIKYADIGLYLNVFNTSTKNFSGNVGFDPYKGAWKFYGNPEMSIEYVSGANAQGYIFTQLY